MHLILSAYQCAPGQGSVSQIGWEWYSRLATQVQLTLVTHSRNRPALEAAGAPLANSQIIWVDSEWFAGPLYRAARWLFRGREHAVFLLASLDYYLFDWLARRQLRQSCRHYDLIHIPTPVSPLATSSLYTLGKPLVLGPWNGGLQAPAAFQALCAQETGRFYRLRQWLSPLTRWGATRHAACILVATRATLATIAVRDQTRCQFMLENAVDPERFPASAWPAAPSAQQPLRVLFVGRLIPVKGVALLLQALARLPAQRPVQLRIVGDGPLRAALEQLCVELGLSARVEFCGAQSAATVAQALQWAHVFCLPSVRESGGAVLLEAMSAARPVIAIDHGGPGELVDDSVGVAIAPRSSEYVITTLAECLLDVIAQPQRWQARGVAGRERVLQQYTWSAKVARALQLYRSLLETTPP